MNGVCGELSSTTCTKPVGRPTDKESEACDTVCCHSGFLTGFCQGGVSLGIKLTSPGGNSGQPGYKPVVNGYSSCGCTNDLKDAKCGPDGSFLGIRCPFDRSACARKCCREGKTGGRCRGFLNLKCRCD